jgi:N-acetylglucosamine kinase-like BadF-type ATPase
VGLDLLARRLGEQRLGELAPAVVALAESGDVRAGELVGRLSDELSLLGFQVLRDLSLTDVPVEVVLGGGMLASGRSGLTDAVETKLRALAPFARPVLAELPPVVGAAGDALTLAGADKGARERLRAAARGSVAISSAP